MHKIDLIGDGVENPHNAVAMVHAAKMFAGNCYFLDRKDLLGRWPAQVERPHVVSTEEILARHDLILALDNHPGAKSIYGYRVPDRLEAALVAGNERLGISRGMLAAAQDLLAIPMVSRKVNCLNVASASAVAMYYLFNRFTGGMPIRNNPQKRRPELLLIGGSDHIELGSAIRSACAFGWSRVFVEDRGAVWFGAEHGIKREARAAARRAKNEIRVIPTHDRFRYHFRRATIVTRSSMGTPLHRARLADGPTQLIVLADENVHDISGSGALGRFADQIDISHIEVPATSYTYYFRLLASIAMAETARQVGQKAPWRPVPQEPLYESALQLISEEKGELVTIEDLKDY